MCSLYNALQFMFASANEQIYCIALNYREKNTQKRTTSNLFQEYKIFAQVAGTKYKVLGNEFRICYQASLL